MPITQLDLVQRPESIWENLSTIDYRSLLGAQEMEPYKEAEKAAEDLCRPMAREAYLGLYNDTADLHQPQGESQLSGLHTIMQAASDLPEWQSLRQATAGDDGLSAFGSASFVKEIFKSLPDEVKAKLKEQQKAQDEVDNLQNALNGMMPGGGPGGQQGQGGSGQGGATQGGGADWQAIQNALKQAQSKLGNANQAVNQALGNNKAQMKANAMKAAKQAGKDLKDVKDTAKAMGWGTGGGQLTRGDLSNAAKLMEYLKNSKQLRKVVDMLGWAQELAKSELKKKAPGREMLVEYTRKPLELETIDPDELLMLGLPPDHPLALDFRLRVANDEVLHQKFEGEKPAARGPLVILKDTSGSTQGDPFAVITAIEYAIMMNLLRDERRFISIPFSGTGSFQVYDPGPKPDMDELVEHLQFAYFGGTEPYGPLLTGADLISKIGGLYRADIVIITDGAFAFPPPELMSKLAELRKSPGLRVIGIVIGDTGAAEEFCDKVISFQSFNQMVEEKDKMRGLLSAVL